MPQPQKIMFIRHGEKPVTPPPAGITIDGEADKHSLIVRGWQRSGALIPFFRNPWRTGISRPDVIIAATTSDNAELGEDDAKSKRPTETVKALVSKLGVDFIDSIPVGDESVAIDAIRKQSGTVLVSWEHKRIATIVAGFMNDPPSWGDRFDAVWVLDTQPDGTYHLTIVNQDLFDGDQPV